MFEDFSFMICSYFPHHLPHLSHQIITTVTSTILFTVSFCVLLSGRCRNSGRTAASSAIRSQTRYISGGEQETEYDRHNRSFGCHYLAQTNFHIPNIFHTTAHVWFSNKQRIIDLKIVYSIILIFNVFNFALNVIRAKLSATKIFKNCFFFLIYLQ